MTTANGSAARLRLEEALAWAQRHRGASLALACALALAATVFAQLAFPADDAEAIAPLVIAGAAGIIGAIVAPGAVDAAMDTATDGVSGWLRTWINSNLDQANNFLTKYLTEARRQREGRKVKKQDTPPPPPKREQRSSFITSDIPDDEL